MSDTLPYSIRFAPVAALEGPVREQFTAILHQSFPPNERESVESIDARLEGGAHLYGAFVGDYLVAFALMLTLDVEGVYLLDYLAVAESHRNQGLGRAFLAHLRAAAILGHLTERPPQDARASFQSFQQLIERYPNSEYVHDARERMVFLRNRLADYEVHVADYYLRRRAYVAAINRAKFCIENYDGAPAVRPLSESIGRRRAASMGCSRVRAGLALVAMLCLVAAVSSPGAGISGPATGFYGKVIGAGSAQPFLITADHNPALAQLDRGSLAARTRPVERQLLLFETARSATSGEF